MESDEDGEWCRTGNKLNEALMTQYTVGINSSWPSDVTIASSNACGMYDEIALW